MFRSARIKLTAWYLFIITLISVFFSAAIYKVLTLELDRVERVQRLRVERRLPERRWVAPLPGEGPFLLDPDLIAETKSRLITMLASIDLAILAASAAAGYFLAGRTLRPIKEMVDEQNRFITDASHELRTPLTALKSEIEVSLRDKKLTVAGAKKLLVSNLEEVNSLQALSDVLIKLTQYQKGENGLTFTEVSLSSTVAEAVRKMVSLAKERRIAIANKVDDFTIGGNKQALTELFVIFLDNAIKYSPEGTKVSLTSEKGDGNVLVRVNDRGIGIGEQEIPHLFERFFRADKSRTKSDVPGYGLGLSIAKQIIDVHGGSIKVESKLNKGTTFTIQLPLKHSRRLI